MEHSKYSPSSMAAIIACPAYANVNEGREDTAGLAAQLGTNCHAWAEELFFAEEPEKELPPDDCMIEDWQESCTRDMVKMALDLHEELSLEGVVKVWSEETLRFHKAPQVEDVFGTADLIYWVEDTKHLVVLDYKTGKGIDVDPKENAQLLTYGCLASTLLDPVLPDKVTLCVTQPRTNPELKRWTTTGRYLGAWYSNTLVPSIQEAKRPDASRIPGETQCRWCADSATCPARQKEMLGLLDSNSPVPEESKSINELALRLPEFRQWLKAVEQAIQQTLESGKKLTDFKLVRGRSNRRWKDPEEAEKFLRNRRLKEDERYNRKLISPTQAEKKLKDKLTVRTMNKFRALIEKPEGKLTWALKSDKREEVLIDPPETELVSIDDLL